MIALDQLAREIPAAEATAVEVVNVPSGGVMVIMENLDAANAMTYKFQKSSDGSTWTDVLFNVNNCADQESVFTIPAGDAHNVKVTPSAPRLRLRAYGSLSANIGIMYRKPTSFLSATAVEILA